MELKPCPFCGKAPIVFDNGTIECLNDECTACLAPPQAHNIDFALDSGGIEAQILRWNTRATDSLLKEMVEVLEWISEDGHAMASMTIGSRKRLVNILQKYHELVGK